MYCIKCGAKLRGYEEICWNCRHPVPKNVDLNSASVKFADNATVQVLADEILKFGIMGAAFSSSGILSILGVIFSCIAFGKANRFLEITGELFGKARAGRTVAKVGLIYGIIATVYFALYFLFVFFVIFTEEIGYY